MLNEAVFRSPKWMRNFVDFEINTGQDIKGEPSKAILKQWDKRWKECKSSDLDMFYSLVIRGDKWPSHVRPSELEEFRKSNRGDMSIWDKYDQWYSDYKKKENQEKEREEQEKQNRINRELDNLFSSMVKDFSNNPYDDKYSTPRRNGKVCFDYTFENGDTFSICGNKITTKKSIYTVGEKWRNKFVNLCNEIGKKGRQRPGGSKSWSSGSSSGSRYSSKTKSDDPNKDRYDKLMDNIRLREEQLKKMSKTDPERAALENELDNYKRAAKRMKERYQFENIKSFVGFFKY